MTDSSPTPPRLRKFTPGRPELVAGDSNEGGKRWRIEVRNDAGDVTACTDWHPKPTQAHRAWYGPDAGRSLVVDTAAL